MTLDGVVVEVLGFSRAAAELGADAASVLEKGGPEGVGVLEAIGEPGERGNVVLAGEVEARQERGDLEGGHAGRERRSRDGGKFLGTIGKEGPEDLPCRGRMTYAVGASPSPQE